MKKAFQKINSDGFYLGKICFGAKGASAHAEAEKHRFFMLIWLYLVCLSSTYFGCSPPQNLLGCSSLWGAISVPMPFYVHSSNDSLQFHSHSQWSSLSWGMMPCMSFALILSRCLAKSFKIPSDTTTYWWTKSHLTIFVLSKTLLLAEGLGTNVLRWKSGL